MIKKQIRPYELSLWTLQDSFISVLKPIRSYNKGQIETPKISIKNDGTQELTFSVPMYYYDSGKLVENPIWYDIKNGVLLVNLRKLKVIFNKGEEGEEIFEFIINQITETHTEGQLTCEVTADGLAFQELGKIGYKISLTEDTYLDEYNEWWEETGGVATDEKPEPFNNINYWCDKVFKNSKWTYSIQMDWSIYDGVIENLSNEERENLGLRRADKIYEEEYTASWTNEEKGPLIPTEMVPFKEKARLVSIEKSNIYNITQTLAETFGVYCKYKYSYDENYHIIGRECIFYNNFLDEKSGKIDINYPYDSSKIEREMDSADVVTKMFVVALEDETSPSGLVTIADVAANKAREDYILNFDYLYSIGTITEEQYGAIDDYERSMYLINTELTPISTQIAKLQSDLADYQAQKTIAAEGQTFDKEQMDQAIALMNAITSGTGILQKTEDTPYRGVLLPDSSANNNTYYIKISQEGIDTNYSFKIYYYQKISERPTEKIMVPYEGSYSIDKDSNGNVYRVSNLSLMADSYSNIYYLTFSYRPQLYYENIYNTFAAQLSKDEAVEKEAIQKISEIEDKITKLEEKYDKLLEEKQLIIADFENLMGPALKEGSWQAENYSDYGSKFKEKVEIGTYGNSKNLHFIWDDKPFEEEQLNYYEITNTNGLVEKAYYPCINLSEILSNIKDHLEDLSIIYTYQADGIKQQFFTIGSSAQFGFIKETENSNPIPVLIITNTNIEDFNSLIANGYIGVVSSEVDSTGVHITTNKLATITWLGLNGEAFDLSGSTYVYPRLEINSLLLKTTDDKFSITYNDLILRKFYDYSILVRDESYLITLDNSFVLSEGVIEKTLNISYELSNAALSLYLDALEVSKTNAFPQVSYTIDVSGLNETFIKYAYKKLNKIVSINDDDLKFEDVQGYISELDLHLDDPWEDEITIQNYKTKFEDLFSSIVASTEQMKTNSFSYDLAADAFTSGGILKPSVIQNTIGQVDLTYAFNNGNLTIDELNGIWATSDDGVVAMRGGGIFCATQKDTYGNWLWNTGITPSGINASLIRAGQIDTNLIKIYAGDNLRLQLNGDGLFAFRSDSVGEAKLDEYVVHNSEGLFLRQPKQDESRVKELIDRVEISWNGLILRNGSGEKVFYADNETGNLSIKGQITATSGDIGGWQIQKNYLVSKDSKAGLRSGLDEGELDNEGKPIKNPYDIFWVYGQDGDNFKVQSDGTLFANNAIIKGTVSAGSIIANATVESVVGAVKKIEIANFNEDCFRHYNSNLDGVITADPSWLRFQIKTNGLTDIELTNSTWQFFYCSAGEMTLNDALANEGVWEILSLEGNNSFSFDEEYLTFIVKDDIIFNGENLIYLKVSKAGKAIKLNEAGQPIEGISGLEYIDTIYETAIQIRLLDFGTDKLLSLIDPPSYTFVRTEENSGALMADFTVTLTNINMVNGKCVGQWYINDVLPQDDINIKDIDKADGTCTSTITIPQSLIPDGGQVVLRYTIVDENNNISANRIAYIFRIKNGIDSYVTLISSTNGTIFRNSNISTTLEAELYLGMTRLNKDENDPYFYVWKEKENENSDYVILKDARTRKLEIIETSFKNKALYSCEIYTDESDVINFYN